MRDKRDKAELAMGAKVKEAQTAKDKAKELTVKLAVAHTELEDERKRNTQLSIYLNRQG